MAIILRSPYACCNVFTGRGTNPKQICQAHLFRKDDVGLNNQSGIWKDVYVYIYMNMNIYTYIRGITMHQRCQEYVDASSGSLHCSNSSEQSGPSFDKAAPPPSTARTLLLHELHNTERLKDNGGIKLGTRAFFLHKFCEACRRG